MLKVKDIKAGDIIAQIDPNPAEESYVWLIITVGEDRLGWVYIYAGDMSGKNNRFTGDIFTGHKGGDNFNEFRLHEHELFRLGNIIDNVDWPARLRELKP